MYKTKAFYPYLCQPNPSILTNMTFSYKSIIRIAVACLLTVGAVSCGPQRHTASKSTYDKQKNVPQTPRRPSKAPMAHIDMKVADNPVTQSLLKEADSWIGTPYAWGGNDRKGVDCSGFVLQVYQRSLKIDLPRNSAKQMEYCRSIKRDELTPGDLVFFTVRGGDRVGHVGIYIGEGNMVHSSSSKGVIITPLDNPYFVKNYHSSGRVERYYALLDKTSEKQTKAAPRRKVPEISLDDLTAQTNKKANKIPARSEKFTTPLPSQVFASGKSGPKQNSPEIASTEGEEEPDYDFFD